MGPKTLVAVVVVLLTGACSTGSEEDGDVSPAPEAPEASEATREDVDCSAEGLGTDESAEFTVAHVVVDGELGALCFGEEDETLLWAWADLATVTPPVQLNDLAVFGGYVASEEGEEETLAFVEGLDDDGETFQMSVNLDAYDADLDEALLTMAHEFSHVFTQLNSQVDTSDEARESCQTYQSSSGCFAPDSLINAWVEEFWPADLLATVDPEAETSVAAGEERCASDPSFFGPYAASDPEEDFAESFSAYVFDLEAKTPEQQEKLDWLADQPGLVEFAERAEDADLSPRENQFERCG